MRRWTFTMTLAMACGGDDAATSGGETSDAETSGVDESDSGVDTSGDDASSSDSGSSDDTTTGDVPEYAAFVRGQLFTADLVEAQGYHDMVAAGGEAQAMQLGDFGHDVVLGTTLLGTTENEFVAIDRWTSLDGALMLYGDAMFQKAFGMLFADPVAPELFERRIDWHGWGELDSADADEPHFFVVVRGRLVADDVEEAHALHDQLASGGEGPAMKLGDVAHVVWLGADDEHEFFAIDVWTASADIESFYANPDLQAGFAMLFDGPPSVGVYQSTDWHQW